jgi:hypothetical protein
MTPRNRLTNLALVLLLMPLPANAQVTTSQTEREVLAVVDTLLLGISLRDTLTSRRLLLPGAVLYAVQGEGSTAQGRFLTDTSYLRRLAADTSALVERIWSPTVLLEGAVAVVWAPYDFHISGAFSHCGVDAFSLLRTSLGWQIASVAYTVQRTGCAPSPLGPPGT